MSRPGGRRPRRYPTSTIVLTIVTSCTAAAALVMAYFGLQALSW